MRKRILLSIIVLNALVALHASISFSGGRTELRKIGNDSIITLSGKAKAETDELMMTSDSMSIKNRDQKSEITCTGNVQLTHKTDDIHISCSNLKYDEESGVLIIDSWTELEDIKNSMMLSSSRVMFDMEKGIIRLEGFARLIKDQEGKLLSCCADVITFDRNENMLTLMGNTEIEFGDDEYRAEVMTFNLDSSEIEMMGRIEGSVSG